MAHSTGTPLDDGPKVATRARSAIGGLPRPKSSPQNRPERNANAGDHGIGAARAFTIIYNSKQPWAIDLSAGARQYSSRTVRLDSSALARC